MHIGVCIFPTDRSIRPDDLARELEARKFESLFVPEHTHIPTSRKSPFAGGAQAAGGIQAHPRPVRGADGGRRGHEEPQGRHRHLPVVERDTITTAKAAASLDALSGGRFLFGIGGGWNAEEMEHHGTEFKTRFKKMEEQVRAMKEIWTKDVAEFHGRFVNFDPIWSWPKPAQKPHPPVLLGGESGTRSSASSISVRAGSRGPATTRPS